MAFGRAVRYLCEKLRCVRHFIFQIKTKTDAEGGDKNLKLTKKSWTATFEPTEQQNADVRQGNKASHSRNQKEMDKTTM